jgi:hypothetical protein
MPYYYIKVSTHLRCEKASNPREACLLAFGVIYDRGEAVYKDIGGKAPRNLTARQVHKLQGPDGWHLIPKADGSIHQPPTPTPKEEVGNGVYVCHRCGLWTGDTDEMSRHERENPGHNMEFKEVPPPPGAVHSEGIPVGLPARSDEAIDEDDSLTPNEKEEESGRD